MIVQNCPLLLEIITRIESMVSEQKTQRPDLNDEEIIDLIKLKLKRENKA